MKKIVKPLLASGICVATVFGVNFAQSGHSHEVVQASEIPYYQFNGYTGNQSSFILDNAFVNAVRSGHVTFNTTSVDNEHSANQGKEVTYAYDQKFYKVSGNVASSVEFPIAEGQVTVDDLIDHYGEDYRYQPAHTDAADESDDGMYSFNFDKHNITFTVYHNHVIKVTIG